MWFYLLSRASKKSEVETDQVGWFIAKVKEDKLALKLEEANFYAGSRWFMHRYVIPEDKAINVEYRQADDDHTKWLANINNPLLLMADIKGAIPVIAFGIQFKDGFNPQPYYLKQYLPEGQEQLGVRDVDEEKLKPVLQEIGDEVRRMLSIERTEGEPTRI